MVGTTDNCCVGLSGLARLQVRLVSEGELWGQIAEQFGDYGCSVFVSARWALGWETGGGDRWLAPPTIVASAFQAW